MMVWRTTRIRIITTVMIMITVLKTIRTDERDNIFLIDN